MIWRRNAGRVATGTALMLLAGCSVLFQPAEIPIGGVRKPITRENLAAARDGMPGGLLEPGWTPDGFALVNADFLKAGPRIESVGLFYQDESNFLHIWQTSMGAEDLGADDPVALGEPLDGLDWNAHPLPVAQTGRPGIVQYSRRLEGGGTATIDTDLDVSTVRRILEGLLVRASEDS